MSEHMRCAQPGCGAQIACVLCGEPVAAPASVVREAWRPIETAPKDSARRLLAGANEMGPWVCTGYWFGGAWRDGGPGYIEHPTHWMPLPTAPGAPEEGAGE